MKMKKGIAIVLALALAFSLVACGGSGSSAPALYTAGTYSAEAQGMESAVKVTITVTESEITKVEIEKIRGVSCDHAVNKLVEYNLVCELGRLDAPGRPLLFGTTEEFLRSFGVQSIDELPVLNPVQVEEFKQEAEAEMHMKLDI